MKKIIRNIKIYFAMLSASIKSMMEYRVDFLVGIFSQITIQAVELIFLWIVFQNTQDVGGWNFQELLLLYGISMLSVAVVDFLFDATYDIGQYYIRKGEFDILLLRPVHPLVSIMGASKSVTAIGYFLLGIILTTIMLIKLQIPITIFLIIKIIGFAVLGGFLLGGIQVLFSTAGFWTYKSNEIVWSVFRMSALTQYPIKIYNNFIKIIITIILPFAFVAYFPAANYLGKEEAHLLWLAPILLIIIWTIAVRVWNWGLRKYRSAGT